MNCLVCHTQVPPDTWQCPKCGDHLGQWIEMNSTAKEYLGEGAFHAGEGNHLRAALCFAKATVLNPKDPAALTALGKLLAQNSHYDGATYYLNKAVSAAEEQGLSTTDGAREAMAAIEHIRSLPTHSENDILGLIAFRRDRNDLIEDASDGGETEPHETQELSSAVDVDASEPWSAVVQAEADGESPITRFHSFLSWVESPADHRRGPWLYLRALGALAAGDQPEAEALFRESASADDSHRNADIYLAHLGARQGDLSASIEFLQAAGRSDADIAETLTITARIQESKRDVASAVTLLENALSFATGDDQQQVLRERLAALQPSVPSPVDREERAHGTEGSGSVQTKSDLPDTSGESNGAVDHTNEDAGLRTTVPQESGDNQPAQQVYSDENEVESPSEDADSPNP